MNYDEKTVKVTHNVFNSEKLKNCYLFQILDREKDRRGRKQERTKLQLLDRQFLFQYQ